MPEPTNIARAVLNSSNGRWYKYEREGDRLKALDPDGLILKPAGSGANAIDVYRVTDERGDFKAMVATAEMPATLKVWARDADTDNLTPVEEVSCTSFAGNRCRFVLAADYSAFGNRAARLDFTDGTAGTITATYDDCTLYEFQNSYQERPGSYRVLAAVVENLDDKRVIFESDDPSVCRIERGSNANAYMRVAEAPQQTDQYCVLIGVGKGTCNVICRSVADPSLEDVVAVTVITHPEDEPKVIGGDLAQELTDLLSGVVVGISGATIARWASYQEAREIERREIVVPGDTDDLFDLTISYAGTVPKWCHSYTGATASATVLFVGVVGRSVTGGGGVVGPYDSKGVHEAQVCYDLGMDCANIINTAAESGTETLNSSLRFFVRGGDSIVFGWARSNPTENISYPGALPGGYYTCEFNASSVTHIKKNDGA